MTASTRISLIKLQTVGLKLKVTPMEAFGKPFSGITEWFYKNLNVIRPQLVESSFNVIPYRRSSVRDAVII